MTYKNYKKGENVAIMIQMLTPRSSTKKYKQNCSFLVKIDRVKLNQFFRCFTRYVIEFEQQNYVC